MIENTIDAFEINPYMKYGNELVFYFGKLINDTDKWMPLPFKENDRFVDFAKGLELQGIYGNPPKINKEQHLVKDFSGFVTLNSKSIHDKKTHEYIFPKIAFIREGTFQYFQSETKDIQNICKSKNSFFTKNGFNLQIYANSDNTPHDEEDEPYECLIHSVNRELCIVLKETYFVSNILQLTDSVRILLNLRQTLENEGIFECRISPLVELVVEKKEYASLLNEMSKHSDMFTSTSAISYHFGNKEITKKSALLNILDREQKENQNNTIDRTSSLPTFNDSIQIIDYLYSKQKL